MKKHTMILTAAMAIAAYAGVTMAQGIPVGNRIIEKPRV